MLEHRGGKGRLRQALLDVAEARGVRVTDLDVKALVGEAAGEVFRSLEAGGEMSLRELREKTGDKGPITMAAVGWLLREDKLVVRVAEDGVKVRLQ